MKTYSSSVFFKDGLKLYVLESQKFQSKLKFEKKFWNAWNLNFHGVKMAVTHFVTHFTHVSRHLGVYCRKQKNCWGKTVMKLWSQMLTKNCVKVHKTTFRKKVRKLKEKKKNNNENVYNLWRILGTKLLLLVHFWNQIFKTVLPKDFF